MYTPFYIGFNLQYGPYAHFGYWTLVSDPQPNKVVQKVEKWCQKVPKEAKAKRDGVINPQNYNIIKILTRKILMLSNATNPPKSTVELGYMCPRGLTDPPAVTLTNLYAIQGMFQLWRFYHFIKRVVVEGYAIRAWNRRCWSSLVASMIS